MRSKVLTAAALGLLGFGLLARTAASSSDDLPKTVTPRLVRLDLLRRPPDMRPRPRRNPFLAGGPSSSVWSEPSGRPLGTDAVPRPTASPIAETSAGMADIRYLGCVTTSRKTVGIVFSGGAALAVAAGETIAGGFVVRTISPEVLVLEGPDGRRHTVSVEGEQR